MQAPRRRFVTIRKSLYSPSQADKACPTHRSGASSDHSLYTQKGHTIRYVLFVVGRGGFEPPKSKTSDLQSDPFGRSGICPYILLLRCGAGDWTRTHNLLITNQLLCQLSYTGAYLPTISWCLGAESNHRQADFQSAALPTELPRHLWRPKTGSNRRPPA